MHETRYATLLAQERTRVLIDAHAHHRYEAAAARRTARKAQWAERWRCGG